MGWAPESSHLLRDRHQSRVLLRASDLEMLNLMLSLLSCGSLRSGGPPRWGPRLLPLVLGQQEGRSIGCRRRHGGLGAPLLGRRRLREMDDLAVGDRRFARGDLLCIRLLVRRRRCRLRSRSPRRR